MIILKFYSNGRKFLLNPKHIVMVSADSLGGTNVTLDSEASGKNLHVEEGLEVISGLIIDWQRQS